MLSSAPPVLLGRKHVTPASPNVVSLSTASPRHSQSAGAANPLCVGTGQDLASSRTNQDNQGNSTQFSRVYFAICCTASLLLVLLYLINNPVKVPLLRQLIRERIVTPEAIVRVSPRGRALRGFSDPAAGYPPPPQAEVSQGQGMWGQDRGTHQAHRPGALPGAVRWKPQLAHRRVPFSIVARNSSHHRAADTVRAEYRGTFPFTDTDRLRQMIHNVTVASNVSHPTLGQLSLQQRAMLLNQLKMEALRREMHKELYETERTPRVVSVTAELPPQDLGAEIYGCFNRGYRQEGCPQAFMDGAVRPVGFNNSGPYVAFMQPARDNTSHVHAATIINLPNGDLLAAWFDGVEGTAGVGIVVSRLPWGTTLTRVWTKPQMVSLHPRRSAQNPVLFFDKGTQTVYLFHTSQLALMGQGTSDVRWLKSRNLGVTWTEPTLLFRRRGAFVRNSALEGAKQQWLLPMYYTPAGYEGYSSHYCTMRRSANKGISWAETRISQPGQFLAQPTTVRLSLDPPVLVTWMRDRRNLFIYVSKSDNDGVSWTTPRRTRLPNNNSGIQALRLLSGAIALVFNNKGGVLDRWPITIALSYDGGETWPYLRDLDREPLHLAYPALTQTPDGLIHIMYSYHREAMKYVAVTEEWVKAGVTHGIFKGDKKPATAVK